MGRSQITGKSGHTLEVNPDGTFNIIITSNMVPDGQPFPTKSIGNQASERQVFTNVTILAGATNYSNGTPGFTDVSKNSKAALLVKPSASCAYTVLFRKRASDTSLISAITASANATDIGRDIPNIDLNCMKCDWGITNTGAVDTVFNAWEVLR
jgi:hypothetical protein